MSLGVLVAVAVCVGVIVGVCVAVGVSDGVALITSTPYHQIRNVTSYGVGVMIEKAVGVWTCVIDRFGM